MNKERKEAYESEYKVYCRYKKYGRFYHFVHAFSRFAFKELIELCEVLSDKIISCTEKVFSLILPYTFLSLLIIPTIIFYILISTVKLIVGMVCHKEFSKGLDSFYEDYNNIYLKELEEEKEDKIRMEIHCDALIIGAITGENHKITKVDDEYVVLFPSWRYLEDDKILEHVDKCYDKYEKMGIKVVFSVGNIDKE